MKRTFLSLAVLVFLLAGTFLPAGPAPAPAAEATAFHAIIIDGDLSDWDIDEDLELYDVYTLYLTWDAANIYLGLDGAFLGDTIGQDHSFFACFDTDFIPGSGAPFEGYGNVTFNTNYFAPEYCYYFAGGAGFYEWSSWNGSDWIWNGWRDDGTFYNWPGNAAPLPGSEFTIIRSQIGNPSSVKVVAWLTQEANPGGPGVSVEASWPTGNPIGVNPTFSEFYRHPDLDYDGISPNIAVGPQGSHVVINEFVPKGTEWIELYNPTTATVSLVDWYLTDGEGIDGLTGTLPAGGYLVTPTANIALSNDGDEIMLYDDAAVLVDMVAYGSSGGTPLAIVGHSAARVPNGYDSDDDARDWNIDQTPTQGAVNDAPPVVLGASVILNEFDNYPAAGNDMVEIYNPTTSTVTLTNWLLSDGDAVAPIVTVVTVAPGGWLVLEETVDWTTSMDFSSGDVGYLFLPDGTRVDQIGWYGEFEDDTFQRICDGEGPNDGYDWDSSGGGITWFDLPETLGASNCAPYEVDAAVVKDGPAGVVPGQRITYTLSFSMNTILPGDDLIITDTLPAEATFVAYTSSVPVTWTGSVDPVVFLVDELYGLQSAVISLTVDVTTTVLPGTELVNTVEITCSGDVTLSNNLDVFTSTVVGSDIGLDKMGPDFSLPGQMITYTLSYEILGDPAEGVVITDVLPARVFYFSDTAPVTPTQPVTGTLVWDLGTVTEAGSFVVHCGISGNPMTWTVRNEAWITASNDADPDNNYAYWDTDLPMPIYEIQHVDVISGTSPSPHLGEHVYVVGVVVGVYPPTSGRARFVLGDPLTYGPWQGLYVFDDLTFLPAVSEGQLLVLGGEVYEYYGMTEFWHLDYYELLTDSWPLPTPVFTTTEAISTSHPETAEPLESVLVQVRQAVVTAEDLGFGEWGITDQSGVQARVDDLAPYAYTPQLGDILNVTGALWYNFDDYKMEPRYDADIEQLYPVTLMYHDLEDVVQSDEAVYVAGDFNGWDPVATPLMPNVDYSVFSVTVTMDMTGTYEYKYVVYTDTVPSGPANWNWLQSNNRSVDVPQPGAVHDYRYVEPGYVVLQWPAATTTTAGMPTENIYGQIWADDLTSRPGAPRALLGEVGFGNDPDPANWADWEAMAWGSQQGNNDEFFGVLTPTASGVYSYVVRFNANWGVGNPHDMWYYGDTDGVYPGDPFEIANAGVLTVLCVPITTTDFTWVPISPTAGLPVTFTATTNGSPPLFFSWDFGDGSTGAGSPVQHTYSSAGVFTVTVTVTNTCSTGMVSYPVTVQPPAAFRVYLPLVTKGFVSP